MIVLIESKGKEATNFWVTSNYFPLLRLVTWVPATTYLPKDYMHAYVGTYVGDDVYLLRILLRKVIVIDRLWSLCLNSHKGTAIS